MKGRSVRAIEFGDGIHGRVHLCLNRLGDEIQETRPATGHVDVPAPMFSYLVFDSDDQRSNFFNVFGNRLPGPIEQCDMIFATERDLAGLTPAALAKIRGIRTGAGLRIVALLSLLHGLEALTFNFRWIGGSQAAVSGLANALLGLPRLSAAQFSLDLSDLPQLLPLRKKFKELSLFLYSVGDEEALDQLLAFNEVQLWTSGSRRLPWIANVNPSRLLRSV